MENNIALKYKGKAEQVGFIPVVRSLPNRYVDTVGHFTFLDQMPQKSYNSSALKEKLEQIKGSTAHPHRGIATFSYIMRGRIEHFDSTGNNGTVTDGGIQWMKAGNGIIHDEIIIPSEKDETTQFGMQFWINLPAKIKAESPEYMAIQSEDVPELILPEKKGKLRILIGEKEGLISKIPTYSKLFLFHLVLNPGQSFDLDLDNIDQTALVLAKGSTAVNGYNLDENELIVFENGTKGITINNFSGELSDVLIFGGEPYNEPIVFGGPYVMNSKKEVGQATKDYYAGKYGEINYSKLKTQ